MTKHEPLHKFDKKTFKKVFNKYYAPLCHLSKYYLSDEDEAKDVVEEAFITLWETKDNLNPSTNLKNFLFTIVKNKCLNILKSKQIHLYHHNNIRNTEIRYQYESLNRLNTDYMELKELKERINIAISKLPEPCRLVFEMSRFEDMKNQEIAEQLGISIKTVEVRMTKSLKLLRTDLADYITIFIPFSILFKFL